PELHLVVGHAAVGRPFVLDGAHDDAGAGEALLGGGRGGFELVADGHDAPNWWSIMSAMRLRMMAVGSSAIDVDARSAASASWRGSRHRTKSATSAPAPPVAPPSPSKMTRPSKRTTPPSTGSTRAVETSFVVTPV